MKPCIKRSFILFLISALMLFSMAMFTACKKEDEGNEGETEETSDTTAEEVVNHKVGFIYNGPIENSTHNLIWENSRTQLERNLGVETCYVENVFVSNFREAVDILLDSEVTVIISTSNNFSNAVHSIAVEYKKKTDTKFIALGNGSTLENLTYFAPLLYQPANVCGFAAAYNQEASSIGVVADASMFNCQGVVNSYVLGAKEFNPKAKAHINFVNSSFERDIKLAIDDLVAKGNDTIMLYLLSDYGIKYCEEIGVKIVAYSGNLPEIASENYITGFYFNVDSYITELVRFIQNGEFIPFKTIGKMDSGHVRMIELNDNENTVSPDTKGLTDLLYSGILEKDRIYTGELKDTTGTVQVENGIILTYENILEISWLDSSAAENIGRFSESVVDLPLSPLSVKGEWADEPIDAANDTESGEDEPDKTEENSGE